jgi:hypothetical protein
MTHIDDFIQNLFFMATDDDPEVSLSFIAVDADLKGLSHEMDLAFEEMHG